MSPLGQALLVSCITAAVAACSPAVSPSRGVAFDQGGAKDTNVFFRSGSAMLTPEAEGIVSMAAEEAKTGNTAAVVVTGHANAAEGQEAGKELAEQRAAAVGRALIEQGVPPQKVHTATGDGAAATAGVRDRRVDVQVVSPARSRPD